MGECGLDGWLLIFFGILMPVFYLQVSMKGKKCIFFSQSKQEISKKTKDEILRQYHHEKKCVACIASNTQEYKGPFVLWGVACYTSNTPAIVVYRNLL
jgi:hypothetical protein